MYINGIYIPKKILEIIENKSYTIDKIGRSEDLVVLIDKQYVLKISKNKKQLEREHNILIHLEDKIPSSKSLYYIECKNYSYLLRTYLDGKSLIDKSILSKPNELIDILVNIKNTLWSLDNLDIPFKSLDNTGNNFIHGDLCLPNIYVNDSNEFIGFIDLGNSGLGDEWYDYAWLIWSFEYNLKTNKYTKLLLETLNIDYDKNKYETYIPKEYR